MERRALARLIIVLALIAGLIALGRLSWTDELMSQAALRQNMEELGALGVALFLIAFVIGELIYLPGIVFVGAAVLAYGPIAGGLTAYAGAIVSVTVSFLVIRAVGGRPLGQIRWKVARRLLRGLERRPILSVAALRVLLFLAPPLNSALALSPIRFRHYLVGSAIGLYFPVAGTTVLFHLALI